MRQEVAKRVRGSDEDHGRAVVVGASNEGVVHSYCGAVLVNRLTFRGRGGRIEGVAPSLRSMDLVDRVGARLLRTRAFARAPIGPYRHGFGWLLGSRILMLEHVGRHSGLPRYVCLEVVARPTANDLTIVSGFGKQAQWYRNITAQPHCYVSVGRLRRAPATASLLGEKESAETLERYQRAHPRAWEHLKSTIERATAARADTLPMVRLSINPVADVDGRVAGHSAPMPSPT